MGFGSIVSGIAGLIAGHNDREFSRAQSEADRQFQREVYQNQLQWKAADAKKAGLHPLAVIGGGSYSASPSSVPSSSSMSDSLGKLGQGVGDFFTAYMNKDEIEKEKQNRDEINELQKQKLSAEIQEISARAMEAAKRSLSYTRPMSSGRELFAGQTDSGGFSSTGRAASPTYAVRAMGDGLYDINFSTDYQQEIGDELGQLVNALKSYTRAGSIPFTRHGKTWRNPETGKVYIYDSPSGYWKQAGWME